MKQKAMAFMGSENTLIAEMSLFPSFVLRNDLQIVHVALQNYGKLEEYGSQLSWSLGVRARALSAHGRDGYFAGGDGLSIYKKKINIFINSKKRPTNFNPVSSYKTQGIPGSCSTKYTVVTWSSSHGLWCGNKNFVR